MSKIVQAVNAMIANQNLISNVLKGESEIFFLYKNKYKWSIKTTDDTTFLWYYPGGVPLERLAANDGDDWRGVDMVTYKDTEIGTKEAKASFSELQMIVKEKVFGVDEVLDDIISDDDI